LHNLFNDKRLNVVNVRKEFFNVTLNEIKEAVIEDYSDIEFTMLAEAKEYRESLTIKENEILIAKQQSFLQKD